MIQIGHILSSLILIGVNSNLGYHNLQSHDFADEQLKVYEFPQWSLCSFRLFWAVLPLFTLCIGPLS